MRKTLLLLGAFVGGVAFVVFSPSLAFDFVPLADDVVVYNNPQLNPVVPASFLHSLTHANAGVWSPLTFATHAIDVLFWGFNPLGHHLTNVLLHSMNAAMVFWLALNAIVAYKERVLGFVHASPEEAMRSNVIAGSVVAALVFALHPLRVENVAWISGRQEIVGTFFLLLTSTLYFTRLEDPERILGNRWLLRSAYLLSLLSSATAVALPALLVVIDLLMFKTGFRNSLKRNVILLLFASVGIAAQLLFSPATQIHAGNLAGEAIAPSFNLLNMAVFSFSNVLFPGNLSPAYSSANALLANDQWTPFVAAALFWLLTIFAVWKARSGGPAFLLAWGAFLLLLLPTISGLGGGERRIADALTYAASVGMSLFAGGWVERLLRREGRESIRSASVWIAMAICFVVFTAFSWKSLQQIKIWRNAATLSSHFISLRQ